MKPMGKKCLACLLIFIMVMSFATSVSAASERIILRVDFVSVGALTHQIKSLDMSLKAC